MTYSRIGIIIQQVMFTSEDELPLETSCTNNIYTVSRDRSPAVALLHRIHRPAGGLIRPLCICAFAYLYRLPPLDRTPAVRVCFCQYNYFTYISYYYRRRRYVINRIRIVLHFGNLQQHRSNRPAQSWLERIIYNIIIYQARRADFRSHYGTRTGKAEKSE